MAPSTRFIVTPLFIIVALTNTHFTQVPGAEEETGKGDGLGTTLNLPMSAYSEDDDYLSAVENTLLPEIQRYKPDLIIISAGFDAHQNDPLAQIQLTTDCFGKMTELLMGAADDVCDGRLLSMLEGRDMTMMR